MANLCVLLLAYLILKYFLRIHSYFNTGEPSVNLETKTRLSQGKIEEKRNVDFLYLTAIVNILLRELYLDKTY